MIALRLEGLDGLKDQLRELESQTAERALRRAARKAFEPVLTTARALVPRRTGLLAENIQLKVMRPKGGEAVVQVGLRIAAGKGQQGGLPPSARWHFVELGTAHMPAEPFLRPALDANAQRVVDVLRDEVAKGIARALKRQRRGRR